MKTSIACTSLLILSVVGARVSAQTFAPEDLEIWNDPTFKRQFIESYMAETEIEPRVTTGERDLIFEVRGLIASDRMDAAISLLEENTGEAASPVIDFTLANIHFQEERFDLAVPSYVTAVEKFPRFRRAWQNLGLIYFRLGEFKKAQPAFTRVIELGGGTSVTFGLLGFSYSNLEKHIGAESAYRMAMMLDPDTLDWKMGLARSLFKQERFAEAASLCASLIAESPDNADLWLLQANAYIGSGQPLRAAENYELVDQLGKATGESLENLGDIYINEGLFDLAVDSYGRAMAKGSPTGSARPLRAARVLVAQGALTETQGLVEQIDLTYGNKMEVDEKKELLKLRARLAVAAGAGDEEARVLEEIVALDPLDGEALILLGQHSLRGGDAEKAVFYYERASSLEEHEAEAKVRHAQLLVGQGKYVEAVPLLERAQQLEPRESVKEYLQQVKRLAQSR